MKPRLEAVVQKVVDDPRNDHLLGAERDSVRRALSALDMTRRYGFPCMMRPREAQILLEVLDGLAMPTGGYASSSSG